ncbi:PQ-loop domain-containing transporter [Ureaplasma ceti]|uniref:PQ loop repeat n=1 Tax=Ureaplasma ceti TaxID=3119530 RepID=A0ABP9U694_9BACT
MNKSLLANALPTASLVSTNGFANTLNEVGYAFGIIAGICIVLISFPQVFKVLKEKKVEKISYTSFWFFHIGILFWIAYAAFVPYSGYAVTLISEFLAILVNTVLMFLLYYYSITRTTKKMIFSQLFNLILLLSSVACLVLYYVLPDVKMNGTWANVLNLIGPAGVVLPFTPQLIKSIRTKHWEAISVWLLVIYTINNIVWIIYFAVYIEYELVVEPNTSSYISYLGGLIWQIIGFVLFDIQLYFTAKAIYLKKSNKAKLTATLEVKENASESENQPVEIGLEKMLPKE